MWLLRCQCYKLFAFVKCVQPEISCSVSSHFVCLISVGKARSLPKKWATVSQSWPYLRISVISLSVCPQQAFPAHSNGGKTIACPGEALFRSSTQEQAPALTHKHQTILEKLAYYILQTLHTLAYYRLHFICDLRMGQISQSVTQRY